MTTPTPPVRSSVSAHRKVLVAVLVCILGVAASATVLAMHDRSGTPTTQPPPASSILASSQPPPVASSAASSPSPSAPTQSQQNCVQRLAACGYPDASSTGAYGQLTPHVGDFTTTTDGQVVANLDISGQLNVVNRNVTVWDVRAESIIDTAPGAAFSYISTHASSSVAYAAGFTDATVNHANIAGGQDNVRTFGAVTISDSYLHDMAPTANSHDDNIQILSGTALTVTHSTLQAYDATTGVANNSSLQIGEQSGNIGAITFTDDWLDGGNYTLSANWGSTDKTDNGWPLGSPFRGPHTIGRLTFTGDRFGPDAHYGLVSNAFLHPPGNLLTWASNVFDTTDAAVDIPAART